MARLRTAGCHLNKISCETGVNSNDITKCFNYERQYPGNFSCLKIKSKVTLNVCRTILRKHHFTTNHKGFF